MQPIADYIAHGRRAMEANLFPDRRTALAQQIALAVLAAGAVAVLGWAKALAAAIALLILLVLICGPSWIMASIFIAYMIFSHQYYSIATVPIAGVEWHPREFLLFLMCGHAAYYVATKRAVLPATPANAWMAMIALFVLLAMTVGFFRAEPFFEVIREFRFGLFVIAFFALLLVLRDVRLLRFELRLLSWSTLAVAMASLAFFIYAMGTGNQVQLNQTPFGEFMQYPFGPITIQMVRPNGHMLFEIGIILCASLVLCRALPRGQRARYVLMGGILGAALLITFMRTAYVSVFVSLCLLLVLLVPRGRARMAIMGAGVFVGLMATIWMVGFAIDALRGGADTLELSLRGRAVEILGALDAVAEHPVLGAGYGSSFEALGLVQSGDQLAAASSQYQTIHNVWIYFLFKGGAAGLLLAGGGLIGLWFYGYGLLRRLPAGFDHALVRGMVAAYGGQLAAALAMPRIFYPQGMVMVALFAIVFAVYASKARDDESGDRRQLETDTPGPPRRPVTSPL